MSAVRDRIIAETRGNPLALLELPRGLTMTELAGGFGLLRGHALSGQIEDSFVRRLETLSSDARSLLLLAAAEPVGDPLLLLRAAEQLGVADSSIGAETDGLLAIGQRVTFRHPLVRSAVYGSAGASERRAAHLALAESTDREVDPDRRAWHLAEAATGPDENVAQELERSAVRAQARGGLAAAAAFLQRAVALTADPTQRVDRALAAAEASLEAGAFDGTSGLLAIAEVSPLDDLQQARVELLRGQMALLFAAGGDGSLLLLRAAERLERLDLELARNTYLDAWGAALLGAPQSARGSLLDVSRAARSAPRPEGPPRPADLLLDSLATVVTDGRAAAAALLEEATRTFADEQFPAEDSLQWGWLALMPSLVLWDEKSTHAINLRQQHAVREAGALARLTLDLTAMGFTTVRCGDFASAAASIAEARAVAEATGAGVSQLSSLMLAAFRGREAEARALVESERQEALALGRGLNSSDPRLDARSSVQRPRPLRGGGGYLPGTSQTQPRGAVDLRFDGDGASRSCNQEREPRAGARIALERIVAAMAFARHRLGSRNPRSFPCPGERG